MVTFKNRFLIAAIAAVSFACASMDVYASKRKRSDDEKSTLEKSKKKKSDEKDKQVDTRSPQQILASLTGMINGLQERVNRWQGFRYRLTRPSRYGFDSRSSDLSNSRTNSKRLQKARGLNRRLEALNVEVATLKVKIAESIQVSLADAQSVHALVEKVQEVACDVVGATAPQSDDNKDVVVSSLSSSSSSEEKEDDCDDVVMRDVSLPEPKVKEEPSLFRRKKDNKDIQISTLLGAVDLTQDDSGSRRKRVKQRHDPLALIWQSSEVPDQAVALKLTDQSRERILEKHEQDIVDLERAMSNPVDRPLAINALGKILPRMQVVVKKLRRENAEKKALETVIPAGLSVPSGPKVKKEPGLNLFKPSELDGVDYEDLTRDEEAFDDKNLDGVPFSLQNSKRRTNINRQNNGDLIEGVHGIVSVPKGRRILPPLPGMIPAVETEDIENQRVEHKHVLRHVKTSPVRKYLGCLTTKQLVLLATVVLGLISGGTVYCFLGNNSNVELPTGNLNGGVITPTHYDFSGSECEVVLGLGEHFTLEDQVEKEKTAENSQEVIVEPTQVTPETPQVTPEIPQVTPETPQEEIKELRKEEIVQVTADPAQVIVELTQVIPETSQEETAELRKEVTEETPKEKTLQNVDPIVVTQPQPWWPTRLILLVGNGVEAIGNFFGFGSSKK